MKAAHKNWSEKLIEQYRNNLERSKQKLVKALYSDELEKLMEQANRAFKYDEGSNCIVFTRSKEMAAEVLELLKDKLVSQEYHDKEGINVVTVTINPMMVKSEEQMYCQIFETLIGKGYTQAGVKGFTSREFWEIFTSIENLGILIVLEELEAHVHSSRQGLLYKLFDLLHYGPIKLFFVAVSQSITVVDSFEKRIKSRYSHSIRQVMLYNVKFEPFIAALKYTLSAKGKLSTNDFHKRFKEHMLSEDITDVFKEVFTKTGSYELLYLMANLILGKLRISAAYTNLGELKDHEVAELVKECVTFARTKIKPPNPVDFVSQLPNTYIVVLIITKKILQSGVEYATFERIYENYKDYHKRVLVKPMKLERAQILKIFLDLIKLGMLIPTDQLLESELLHKSKVQLRIPVTSFDAYIAKDKMKIPEQMKEWAGTPLF